MKREKELVLVERINGIEVTEEVIKGIGREKIEEITSILDKELNKGLESLILNFAFGLINEVRLQSNDLASEFLIISEGEEVDEVIKEDLNMTIKIINKLIDSGYVGENKSIEKEMEYIIEVVEEKRMVYNK